MLVMGAQDCWCFTYVCAGCIVHMVIALLLNFMHGDRKIDLEHFSQGCRVLGSGV